MPSIYTNCTVNCKLYHIYKIAWTMNLRLTALRTLLSRGFLLGSLVEERIPVPQLLAKVFL